MVPPQRAMMEARNWRGGWEAVWVWMEMG